MEELEIELRSLLEKTAEYTSHQQKYEILNKEISSKASEMQ